MRLQESDEQHENNHSTNQTLDSSQQQTSLNTTNSSQHDSIAHGSHHNHASPDNTTFLDK